MQLVKKDFTGVPFIADEPEIQAVRYCFGTSYLVTYHRNLSRYSSDHWGELGHLRDLLTAWAEHRDVFFAVEQCDISKDYYVAIYAAETTIMDDWKAFLNKAVGSRGEVARA